MIWASFHSATISVDGFGSCTETALAAMTWAWQQHASKTNQDPDMLSTQAENISFVEIRLGDGFINNARDSVRVRKMPYSPGKG